MATDATCHRYFEGMFPGDTPYWFSKIGIMKVVMESGFCPVCGAELRPDGTAGPGAAELAARLETAEKPLSEDDKHDIGLFMQGDALRVLRRLNSEAEPFDGFLPESELGNLDTQTAWGLVQCDFALQECLGTYVDPDGHDIPEWGFAINSEGYAVLLLADRRAAAAKDTRRMDALEKAAAEWDYFEVIRPYPVSAIYVGDQAGDAAKADTIRALADALEVAGHD